MNTGKAAYFDSQVDSKWAFREYTNDELERIDRMLSLAGWTSAMRILEPGCGTGRLTELLADRSADAGFIMAVDISENMVQAASDRLGQRDNARVECEALENLPLVDEEFDLVILPSGFSTLRRQGTSPPNPLSRAETTRQARRVSPYGLLLHQ